MRAITNEDALLEHATSELRAEIRTRRDLYAESAGDGSALTVLEALREIEDVATESPMGRRERRLLREVLRILIAAGVYVEVTREQLAQQVTANGAGKADFRMAGKLYQFDRWPTRGGSANR